MQPQPRPARRTGQAGPCWPGAPTAPRQWAVQPRPMSLAQGGDSLVEHDRRPPPPPPLTIRPATEDDWWAIAALHVDAFFPGSGMFNPLLRLDRVMGLEVGYSNAASTRPGVTPRGEFLCLVAEAADAPASPTSPHRPGWPAAWLPSSLWGAFTADPAAAGILGAVVVDAQAGHVPPRTRRQRGTVRLEPRAGLAYISNLAVATAARRTGIGLALVQAAEAQAWEWGCHGIALHVNLRDNAGAGGLYARAGFRTVGPGSEGGNGSLGGLLGPSGQPLSLMLKVRPRRVCGGSSRSNRES